MLANLGFLGVVLFEESAAGDEFHVLLGDGEILETVIDLLKHLGCELEFRSVIDEFLNTEDHPELGFVGCLAKALENSKVSIESGTSRTPLQVGKHFIDDNHETVVWILLLKEGHHDVYLFCVGTQGCVCGNGIIDAEGFEAFINAVADDVPKFLVVAQFETDGLVLAGNLGEILLGGFAANEVQVCGVFGHQREERHQVGFTGTVGADNLDTEGLGGRGVVQVAADGRDDALFVSVGENEVPDEGFAVFAV